jgi:hypothetical protein
LKQDNEKKSILYREGIVFLEHQIIQILVVVGVQAVEKVVQVVSVVEV